MRPIIPIFATVLVVCGASLSALADTPSTPCSYKVESANKEFVAVVLAPQEARERECLSQGPEKKKEADELRKNYPSGGVYSRVSAQPKWTFDWWASTVHLANDGRHLVREGPWASEPTDEAVSFFEDGKLLKTYQVNELVSDMSKVRRSVSHFEWENGFVLDDASQTLTISTLERKRLKFDLATGELIPTPEETKPSSGFCLGSVLLLGLAILSRCRIR